MGEANIILKEKIEDIPRIIELEEQNKIEIRYISSQVDDERKKILALMVLGLRKVKPKTTKDYFSALSIPFRLFNEK